MTVAVIIVNWNSGAILRQCLEALAVQSLPPKRVIVVDNASTDRSLEGLEAALPQVEIHRMQENLGFAAGNNRAARAVDDCEWLALLNPDAIPEPDWLEKLSDAARQRPGHASYACCMLAYADPSLLDGAGDIYHVSGLGWRRFHGHLLVAEAAALESCEVFSACAGAALYRREAFLDVGGFDERFFCYFEDVDLGFRLQLSGGRCWYVADAVVRHVGSVCTGKKSDFSVYYGHRNLVWTFVKNMPWPLLLLYLPQHLLLNLYTVAALGFRGQGRAALKAKRDALRGIPEILQERRRVQRCRKAEPWALRRLMATGLSLFRR